MKVESEQGANHSGRGRRMRGHFEGTCHSNMYGRQNQTLFTQGSGDVASLQHHFIPDISPMNGVDVAL